MPLTLVNALVAFGAIHELTGFGLHGEVNIGQRATLYTSPDQDLRNRGYVDGERQRPQP